MADPVEGLRQVPIRLAYHGKVLPSDKIHAALRQPTSVRAIGIDGTTNHSNLHDLQAFLLPVRRQHLGGRIRDRRHLRSRTPRHAASLPGTDVSAAAGRQRVQKPSGYGGRFFPVVRSVLAEIADSFPAKSLADTHLAMRFERDDAGPQGGQHVGDEVLLRFDQSKPGGEEPAGLQGAPLVGQSDFDGVRSAIGHEFDSFVRVLFAFLYVERGRRRRRRAVGVRSRVDEQMAGERFGYVAEEYDRRYYGGDAGAVERDQRVDFEVSLS